MKLLCEYNVRFFFFNSVTSQFSCAEYMSLFAKCVNYLPFKVSNVNPREFNCEFILIIIYLSIIVLLRYVNFIAFHVRLDIYY